MRRLGDVRRPSDWGIFRLCEDVDCVVKAGQEVRGSAALYHSERQEEEGAQETAPLLASCTRCLIKLA